VTPYHFPRYVKLGFRLSLGENRLTGALPSFLPLASLLELSLQRNRLHGPLLSVPQRCASLLEVVQQLAFHLPMDIHMLSIFGPYLVYIWSIGPHLVHIWSIFGPYLVHIWSIFGLYLVHIWSIGPHLVHIWSVFGRYLVHIWSIFGSYLIHIWSIFGP